MSQNMDPITEIASPGQYYAHPASYYNAMPPAAPYQQDKHAYNPYAMPQQMYHSGLQIPFYSMYPGYPSPHMGPIDMYPPRQPSSPVAYQQQLYRPLQHVRRNGRDNVRMDVNADLSNQQRTMRNKNDKPDQSKVLQPVNMNKQVAAAPKSVAAVVHSPVVQSVAKVDFPIPLAISPTTPGTAFLLDEALKNPRNTTNVYIRGLAPDITDDVLVKMTSRFGALNTAKAMMDNSTGLCKGFGFAQFETEEEAAQCICGLAQYGYQTSFAKQSFSLRLKELQDTESTNVYFSNIPRFWDKAEFKQLLDAFPVVSFKVLRDGNGNNRGVGFARFTDRSVAEDIIKTFNGQPIGEGGLPMQVRFSDTEAQKRLKQITLKKRNWRAHEYHLLAAQRALEEFSISGKNMLMYRPTEAYVQPTNAGQVTGDLGTDDISEPEARYWRELEYADLADSECANSLGKLMPKPKLKSKSKSRTRGRRICDLLLLCLHFRAVCISASYICIVMCSIC
ncbi:hypothetical protein V1512DRAFT_243142 [Lipomyces arxii]|uniref:uncharacterized protein n=1 Tax=Lipomyces arxii TaxID=56418 RepID=UPI0034CF38D0